MSIVNQWRQLLTRKWQENESICLTAGNLSKQTGGNSKLPEDLRQPDNRAILGKQRGSAIGNIWHVRVEECECWCMCVIFRPPKQILFHLFMFQPHQ